MSAPPYQKLFWGSYHKHTAHLRHAREHGAYLLLIAALWNNGGRLPADDATLAAYAMVTSKEWEAIKPKLSPLFRIVRGRLTQPRVTEDLAKYADTSGKRKQAGKAGGLASARSTTENRPAIARRLVTKPEPEPEEGEDKLLLPLPDGESEPRGKPRRKPEVTIPEGYPDDAAITEGQDRLRTAGVNLDARVMAERFRNHALQNDRRCRDWSAAWRNWVIGERDRAPKVAGSAAATNASRPAPTYDGPPELRAWIVSATDEGFAESYVDTAKYDRDRRMLIARNSVSAGKLNGDADRVLRRANVSVITAEDYARLTEGADA